MRKRIALVIRLFAEAQKALISMPMLFVLPFITYVIVMLFLSYWTFTSLMIYIRCKFKSIKKKHRKSLKSLDQILILKI